MIFRVLVFFVENVIIFMKAKKSYSHDKILLS